MKPVRAFAAAILGLIFGLSICPSLVTADDAEEQFRTEINVSPGRRYPLGTDELGRNRLARLLSGTRTSLLLAPAASGVSIALACCAALAAVSAGRIGKRIFELIADLMGSLPWLFVLIALRASLPLDAPASATLVITFSVLAVLGWAGPARVLRNVAAKADESEFMSQARALGLPRWKLASVHLLPNVWPIAAAQFWINIPVFILAEANLGLLGLGVAEPFPSLGSQLKELESYTAVTDRPWLLAPAVLLTSIVALMWMLSKSGGEA